MSKRALDLWWFGPPSHIQALAVPGWKVTRACAPAMVPREASAIVVDACAGDRMRSWAPGLRWLQRVRREARSLAPALVYSFEKRESLVSRFPLLARATPGVAYLRLPFGSATMQSKIQRLAPLTDEQLIELVRWSSGLQDEWRRLSHAFGAALGRWPEDNACVQHLIAEWSISIREYAPDQEEALRALEDSVHLTANEIRSAAQRLEDGLCRRMPATVAAQAQAELPPAPFRRPPQGFAGILLADDSRYERSRILALRQLGYSVEHAIDLEVALQLLSRWCPSVVIADLSFPTVAAGRELLARALATRSVRVVIAASRRRAHPGELPALVEDCCGPLDFQDAAKIHRMIWRRAATQGVTEHA